MVSTAAHRRQPPASRRSGSLSFAALAIAALVATGVVSASADDEKPATANARASATEPAGDAFVRDDFNRESTGGWGASQKGGAYELSAARYFSSHGGQGVATLPRPGSAVTATLPTVAPADTISAVKVSAPTIPASGNGVYAGLQSRSTGDSYYQASVRIAPQGKVWLSVLRVNGSTATQETLVRDRTVASGLAPGAQVNLELRVSGSSVVELSARAWVDGQQKPEWQATIVDSSDKRLPDAGKLAVWSYVSSGSAAQSVAFDDLIGIPSGSELPGGEESPAQPVEPTPEPAPGTEPAPTPDIEPAPAGRQTAGSAAVGTTSYPVPNGAVYVAPRGSDSNTGTQAAPFASVKKAVASARSGSTIVLREGIYHEYVLVPNSKKLTIQAYPKEEVWFDGSRALTAWSKSGKNWVTGWDVTFDSSPTYSRGAPDGQGASWRFVSPEHPMAAHPDQVFINGNALDQVSSASRVTAGTFYVDAAAKRLVIGSDPTGKQVRASDTVKAFTIAGAGSVLRGVGIRNYAPSVPDMGAVQVAARNVTLENVQITDSATTGLSVFQPGAQLRNVTVERSGMLGAHASAADGLTVTGMLSKDNNTEGFNRAPVAGGLKVHKSRGVTVADSSFVGNRGNALWFDESVYDMAVTGNDILSNTGNGLVLELSAKATVANNLIADSGLDGILISETGHVQVWNNTLSGNDRSINIVEGYRIATDLSQTGHDRRQKLPDPTVTWTTENITVSNNILASGNGKCVLCVEDYSHKRSGSQMRVVSDGNVIHRLSASEPTWAVVWSRGPGNPAVYNSVAEFAAATGQDRHSLAVDGTPVLTDQLAPTAAVAKAAPTVARPLPDAIAAAAGGDAGSRHLGAWK